MWCPVFGRFVQACKQAVGDPRDVPAADLHGPFWEFITKLNNDFETVGIVIVVFFLTLCRKSSNSPMACQPRPTQLKITVIVRVAIFLKDRHRFRHWHHPDTPRHRPRCQCDSDRWHDHRYIWGDRKPQKPLVGNSRSSRF